MLDDLFKESRNNRNSGHYGYDDRHDRHGNENYGHDGYRYDNPLLTLAQKILRNKVLLAGIVFILLLIGAVGIWIITAILPYLGQIVSIAEKQGIKGIMDTITPLLQKIWEGAGK